MGLSRQIGYAVAVTIVLVTLATGPLSAIQVPEGGLAGQESLGEGNATITVEQFPERATLTEREYEDLYYLETPDTTVRYSNVSGAPILVYSVSVEEIGFSRGQTYVVTPEKDGHHRLSVGRETMDANRIEQQEYTGTLELVLHTNGKQRMIANRSIVVGVES